MLVLDTDTFSELQMPGSKRERILRRIEESGFNPAITIVTVEQTLSGWINKIARVPPPEQVLFYARLGSLVEVFRRWSLIPFDKQAATKFVELKHQWPRVGNSDLKIAAIILCHNDALLLTGNMRDFIGPLGERAIDWRN